LPRSSTRRSITAVSKRRHLSALAGLAALALVSCGGDDGGDDGGGPPSRTAWSKQANAICAKANSKARSLPKNLGRSPDDPARRKEREILEEKFEGLRSLDPPDDVAEDFERMITLHERSAEMFGKFLALARQPKTEESLDESVRFLSAQQRLGVRFAKIAKRIGLPTCAGA
jgi:hypothetical protein